MAIAKDLLGKGLSGKMGELVYKRYKDKTAVHKSPDMSQIQPSELQKQKRSKFAEAVAYAKAINNDPAQKALYKTKVKRGQTVYHYSLGEYMKRV